MSEVRDLEGLKSLTGDQAETLKFLSEQFTADWKAWQDYFNESREQIQKVFGKTRKKPPKPARKLPNKG